jgi:hypothetical protein
LQYVFWVNRMETVTEDLYTVQKIKAILQRLSPERLRVAAEFLAYLDERESNDATEELLSIPNFLEDYQEAMQDIENGDVVPLKIIRRHV